MNKVLSVLVTVMSAIGAFLMLLIRQKNRELEKKDDEIKQHKSKAEQQQFIAEQETETKNATSSISSASESDIDSMLEQTGSYRD
ncbi:DUF2681 domain-containing protein [Ignatzschineria cameli]|uniref:DUF2681 domain-containing protein n=2 Tax=Bacteria TaxID=2 RepID=A0A2U2AQI1_9GAMM|nr:DUF2681 domain-containing protein [Ignatzschineria cameli]TWS20358.1 DUF2681 domain-containing protein [Tsukamurella sputi]PWD85818.1 hypothetical protein DC077_07235 [Ignatzschineria cameli]PWD89446.1 hypothetical protein DC079_06860 [Ignatzschineria cameli]PWD90918.1 hypothetical protein DC081_06570 [Ignatzschineria cameli]PWD91706.1 hypothetical protein DC078_06855 [Ignatzschineria cameli]